MAASEGIAKRASIGVGFTDTSFIDNMERFNRLLKGSTSQLSQFHNALDHTDQSISELDQHMNMFADRHGETMDRICQHNRDTAGSTDRLNETSRRLADTYGDTKDKIVSDNDRMDQSERQRYQNAIHNEHGINEALSRRLTNERRAGDTASHVSDRVVSANGRVAHSFRYANNGLNRHIQSIRDAQGRDYHWLRTAQAMSLTTLGLGANLYKGAKDVGTLQQSYLHAGNMAHYGGEKISQVQHDINNQWRVGSQLAIKYGVSQDQIAQGYKALVARGYSTNEALHTQKSLLQAAIASGDSYNDVVQGTTNVLDAYNLRSNNAATMTNNTKKVTDEMAYAADQTASNFRDLSTGMAYVAATAHTTNQPISETSSALGILSNKGMQASMAGVGLRKVLNSFLSINKKGQQAQVMQQLGLNQNSFRTASGHLKSLGQLMGILNAKTKNMGSAERGAVFHRFFGATGQEAALNLASDTKGLKQLNNQVERSQNMGNKHQGYVALLSAHNMKSAQNQFNVFKQAWQAFMITSAREILPTFTDALKHADVYLAKMNNLSPRAKKWTIFGALAVAAISPISYAIFGIQSAFHGVELTLLHVRKLFARPVSNNMSNSAYKNAQKQEAAALLDNEKTGRSSYMDKLGQYEFDHPHLTKMRLRRQRLGARMWATNRGALSHLTDIGGDASVMAKPSLLARLNPLNRSARFLTRRHLSWIPGVHRLPTVTGHSASYLLRGSGMGMMTRVGGSLLGKANIITGIATSLPLVEKGLKWIDKTRIGGKLFAPLNKSLIKGMNGSVKFIDRSWRFIKRGALAGIKPIEHELHTMFGGTSKASRANLRGIKTFVHISTRLIGGLWRTIAKVLGNVLKYGGRIIADAIKSVRGFVTIVGGAFEVINNPRKGWHQMLHGIKLLTSGIGTGLVDAIKGLGSIAGNVLNGIWSTIKKITDSIGNLTHIHPIKWAESALHSHASGGAIQHDQMSLVDENGQESAYNPSKNTFRLLGNNGPQVLKLYAGEHVLDAHDTHELLNGGLGRGVTLPGYAHGTDSIHGILHGYAMGTGRAGEISAEEASEPGWLQHLDSELANTAESFSPSNLLRIPHDSKAALTAKGLKGKISNGADVLGDLPSGDFLKSAKLSKLTKLLSPGKGVADVSGRLQDLGRALNDPIGHIMSKVPILHSTKGFLHSLPKDFSKVWPKLKSSMAVGRKFMIKALNGPIKRGIGDLRHNLPKWQHEAGRDIRRIGHGIARGAGKVWRGIKRFGRGTMRFGRRMFRSGRRLLSRAGHGLARFGRSTWSRAKRLGRRLWTGTKHVAGRMWSATRRTARRMWNSAKRTGKDIWSHAKRIASDVGRTARSLWNKTKSGASRTWSRVISGARRMASSIGHTTSRLFHEAIAKGRNAWSAIRSGASHAVSAAKSMLSGLMSFAHSVASRISSMMSHLHFPHFALGGQIRRNTMALVGEHGPESAYNARTGTVRMLGLNGPQITMLLDGESVLTNTQTNRLLHGGLGRGSRLPAYAQGTNARLSGPASRSSVFSVVGSFHGKQALNNMRGFNKHAKDIWDDVSSHITGSSHDVSKEVTKTNSDLSDTTRDIFKDMSKKVSSLSDDLRDGLIQAAHDMAEGFGDKFKKLIDYAKEDMESVIDKLNRGVTGIDHALRAFGGNSHVIHPIHYATGTMNGRIAYNQLGILNDAISGPRQEAILRGSDVLFPQGDNVPVPLQKGDAVLNGDQTKQLINNTTNINHYAKGSGFHLSMKLVDSLSKILSAALKGPSKFFNQTFMRLMPTDGHQVTKGIETMAKHPFRHLGDIWTRAMFRYIKNLISPQENVDASANAFLNYAMKLAARAHYRYSELPGRTGPSHYDCSGLVYAALSHFGIHTAGSTAGPEIFDSGFEPISRSQARIGDLVGNSGHIGIVANNDATKYYSAFSPSYGIGMHPLDSTWWDGGSFNFRRVPQLAKFNKAPKKNKTPFLQELVSRELGHTAISWLKKAASLFGGGAGIGAGAYTSEHIPGGAGSWTKHGSQAYNMAKAVFASAESLGLDAKHAAAMVGNACHESAGFQYGLKVNQFGGGGGKGLFQFTGQPSKYGWSPYAQDKSILANALPGQEHAWKRSGGSPASLAHSFETTFERGSIPAFAARDAAAETAYHMFAANGGWADRNHMRIFGEAGPEVAINPARSTADHYIVEAINARMHHNPTSPMANLVHSIAIRNKGSMLQTDVSSLLHHAQSNNDSNHKAVNIHISFGNIVVNGNGGNVNTSVLTNKIKRAAKQAIMKAAYESATKLD